jgi:hypothetical protein
MKHDSLAWALAKAEIAAIDNPDHTVPVGNCPECRLELVVWQGRVDRRYHCVHQTAIQCSLKSARIADEETLGGMRSKVNDWILENAKC